MYNLHIHTHEMWGPVLVPSHSPSCLRLKPSPFGADIRHFLSEATKKPGCTVKISICNRFECLLPKGAFSFLSSCFTNSYFEIKLVFTPVKEKIFFYQPKWASLGQSQRSQTSWQRLIKQTSYLIPPVSQRYCRWGKDIIPEVLRILLTLYIST